MQKIIVINTILAIAAAGAANVAYHTYVPLAKSTLTTSSQAVDHGSTHVLHTPVLPLSKATLTHSTQTVDHGSTHVLAPLIMTKDAYHVPVAKTTSTRSSHVVNHGPALIHTPVSSFHYNPFLIHSAPVLSYKTPDSAFSHQSSTVHETVPIVSTLPVYFH